MEQNLDKKRLKILATLKKFTLMDDTFMTQVFSGNIAATEYVLKVILKRDDLRVEEVKTQLPISNVYGRSARLDIYARDAQNKQYDIEIQQKDEGATPKRARLNSALFDANLTGAGEKYNDIPETYVIFITEHDVLGSGFPIYNIERIIEQSGESFNDEEHIVYVNGAYRKDDAIGQLMQDFHCADFKDIKSKTLAQAVQYYKEDPKGVDTMCDAMDQLARELAEDAAIETAMRMIARGKTTLEEIAEDTGLPLSKIQELAASRIA